MGRVEEFIQYFFDRYGEIPDQQTIASYLGEEFQEEESHNRHSYPRYSANNNDGANFLLNEVKDTFAVLRIQHTRHTRIKKQISITGPTLKNSCFF